jgi:hypothetical protein
MYENSGPQLTQKPSYDMGRQALDERDEVGLLSEEESDDEPGGMILTTIMMKIKKRNGQPLFWWSKRAHRPR